MKERRRAPRIPAKLAMEIKLGSDESARAESINVSANGIYFSSKTYIEPLTRLQITLILPKSDPLGRVERYVVCEGIVVRTVPEEPLDTGGEYEIACYFTGIADNDKEKLESYILNQLTF